MSIMCYRFEFQGGNYYFMIKTFLDRIMEHKIKLRIALIYGVYKKVNPVRLIISFQHKLFRKGKNCFARQGKTGCILEEIFLAFMLQHGTLKK